MSFFDLFFRPYKVIDYGEKAAKEVFNHTRNGNKETIDYARHAANQLIGQAGQAAGRKIVDGLHLAWAEFLFRLMSLILIFYYLHITHPYIVSLFQHQLVTLIQECWAGGTLLGIGIYFIINVLIPFTTGKRIYFSRLSRAIVFSVALSAVLFVKISHFLESNTSVTAEHIAGWPVPLTCFTALVLVWWMLSKGVIGSTVSKDRESFESTVHYVKKKPTVKSALYQELLLTPPGSIFAQKVGELLQSSNNPNLRQNSLLIWDIVDSIFKLNLNLVSNAKYMQRLNNVNRVVLDFLASERLNDGAIDFCRKESNILLNWSRHPMEW